jgi:hypothetical protein
LKIYFAPDTSDHPNWGCRVMGDWFRNEFARAGYPHTWRTGSQWFYRQHPQLERLRTLDDFRHHAGEVEAGRILPDLASMLRECDLVFLNGENFIRPGSHKGRMLLFIAYLAKAVFNKPCVLANHSLDLDEADLAGIAGGIYPLLDEVHFREETSFARGAPLAAPGRSRLIPDVALGRAGRPARGMGGPGAPPGDTFPRGPTARTTSIRCAPTSPCAPVRFLPRPAIRMSTLRRHSSGCANASTMKSHPSC